MMGRRKLDKVRWQVKVASDIARAFDAVLPAGKTRSDLLESLMVAHLKRHRPKPRSK